MRNLLASNTHLLVGTATNVNSFRVINPSSLQLVATVKETPVPEQVVTMCHSALKSFKQTTPAFRRSLLNDLSSLILKNHNSLAEIMTDESGKPLTESKGEINYAVSFLKYYADPSNFPSGRTIEATPSPFPGKNTLLVQKQCVGVCGFITPWNFPISMITRKLAPAIMMGSPCVLKPSELTPLIAIALEQLAIEANFPPNTFRLILASKEKTPEVGKLLAVDSRVPKISFTGSTEVGKLLLKMSADSEIVKRVSLELGGAMNPAKLLQTGCILI